MKHFFLFCLLYVCSAMMCNGADQWVQQSSGTSEHLLDVSFYGGSLGIAVGTGNTILTTTNGGASWIKEQQNRAYVNAVCAVDDKVIYATAANGIIMKSMNGGRSWNENNLGNTILFQDIQFYNEGFGIAVGNNLLTKRGILYATADSGAAWHEINTPLSVDEKYADSRLVKIAYTFNGSIVIIGNRLINSWDSGMPIVLVSRDNGLSWEDIPMDDTTMELSGISTYNETIYVVGNSFVRGKAAMYYSEDYCATWKNGDTLLSCLATDILFVTPQLGYVCGSSIDATIQDGSVLQTTDGGATWSAVNIGTMENVLSLTRAGGTTVTAVGTNGLILRNASPCPLVTITQQPQSYIAAHKGQSVTISCQTNDNSDTYQWYKNDEKIDDAISRILVIDSLMDEHAGIYRVKIQKKCGTTQLSNICIIEVDNTIANKKLEYSQYHLPFGTIKQGTKKTLTLHRLVKNVGTENVTLTNAFFEVNDKNQFSLISPMTFPIVLTPGTMQQFVFEFSGTEIGEDIGLWILEHDAPFMQDQFIIQGTVTDNNLPEKELSMLTNQITFDGFEVGTTKTYTVQLAQTVSTQSVTITEIALHDNQEENFSVEFPSLPYTLAKDSLLTVTVHFTPRSIGELGATLVLRSDAGEYGIAVGGYGVPKTRFDMGKVYVQTTKDTVFRYTNTEDSPIIIRSVMSTDSRFIIGTVTLPTTLGIGEIMNIPLSFRPQETGNFSSALVVKFSPNESSNEEEDIFMLSGEGIGTTSVHDDDIVSLRIFPNPTKEYISIETNSIENIYRIDISNLQGIVLASLHNNNTFSNTLHCDISTFEPGLYSVKVYSTASVHSYTFMVVR